MIHTGSVEERCGLALSHLARGNVTALRRLEMTLAPGKHAEYAARLHALHVMALSWGIERQASQVLWAEAEGKRNAKALLDAYTDVATAQLTNIELARSMRGAADGIAAELREAASRLVGLELALDDLGKTFCFDSRAVRLMAGIERFRPAEIEVDGDTVAKVRQQITAQLTQALQETRT
jgi:hypothetical protein